MARKSPAADTEPTYFASAAAFRGWLQRHAATSREIVVGFMKRATGAPSITWPEAVDEALCVGWIDGVRHRIDDERYKIRFTPRKPGSVWSAVNIARFEALQAEGRMQPAGVAAFEKRSEARSRIYSHEQAHVDELPPDEVRLFRRHPAAWKFFEAQPPSYRKRMLWRLASAKQPATRARRLQTLIEACAEGRRL
jgi:uncharacterized protein YdeI (YjbR/CyaY-like superfamily)